MQMMGKKMAAIQRGEDGSRGYTRKVLRCMRHSGGLSVSLNKIISGLP